MFRGSYSHDSEDSVTYLCANLSEYRLFRSCVPNEKPDYGSSGGCFVILMVMIRKIPSRICAQICPNIVFSGVASRTKNHITNLLVVFRDSYGHDSEDSVTYLCANLSEYRLFRSCVPNEKPDYGSSGSVS